VGPIRDDPEENPPSAPQLPAPIQEPREEVPDLFRDTEDYVSDRSSGDEGDNVDLLERHVMDLTDMIRRMRTARRISREVQDRNFTEILVRSFVNSINLCKLRLIMFTFYLKMLIVKVKVSKIETLL